MVFAPPMHTIISLKQHDLYSRNALFISLSGFTAKSRCIALITSRCITLITSRCIYRFTSRCITLITSRCISLTISRCISLTISRCITLITSRCIYTSRCIHRFTSRCIKAVMVFFYYIIRDYYLPLRTGNIAADLLGWLLYIVRARINLIYRGCKISVH